MTAETVKPKAMTGAERLAKFEESRRNAGWKRITLHASPELLAVMESERQGKESNSELLQRLVLTN